MFLKSIISLNSKKNYIGTTQIIMNVDGCVKLGEVVIWNEIIPEYYFENKISLFVRIQKSWPLARTEYLQAKTVQES